MTKEKPKIFENVGKFFREFRGEIKKIVWPTPKAVFRNTGVVLTMIIIVGLFIFGLDTALLNLLGTFMSVSK